MNKQIVLVEDDEPIRDTLSLVFEDSGIDLVNLVSGEKIFNDEIDAPNLFILDKQLSGANGLDVCRYIKKNEKYKNVPVIMLSASPDIVWLAREAGADEAITKPFSLRKLRETVFKYVV